jgi:hypothetical protein
MTSEPTSWGRTSGFFVLRGKDLGGGGSLLGVDDLSLACHGDDGKGGGGGGINHLKFLNNNPGGIGGDRKRKMEGKVSQKGRVTTRVTTPDGSVSFFRVKLLVVRLGS